MTMETMRNLQEWFMENRPRQELFAAVAAENQIMFVRDRIAGLLSTNLEEYKTLVKVCGEHTSKSVKLPVYYIEFPKYKTKFCFRGNFHDWNLAVESERPLTCNFLDLFSKDNVNYMFYEGFPEQFRYEKAYDQDPKRFNCSLGDNNDLYCFFRIIRHHLGIKHD